MGVGRAAPRRRAARACARVPAQQHRHGGSASPARGPRGGGARADAPRRVRSGRAGGHLRLRARLRRTPRASPSCSREGISGSPPPSCRTAGGGTGRRGSSGRPSAGDGCSGALLRPLGGGGAVRWRDQRRRWCGAAARRAGGRPVPRPGADRGTPEARPRVGHGHRRRGHARPRSRAAPWPSGPDPRAFPSVLRVRLPGRLRRDPLGRAVLDRLRLDREDDPGLASRRAGRRDRAASPARNGGWSGAAPAAGRLGGDARRDQRGLAADPPRSRAPGLRGRLLRELRRRVACSA